MVPRFALSGFVKLASCNSLFERQNDEVVNGTPAYMDDEGTWLCYNSENKWWTIQPANYKGTTQGWAHTSKGEAPWDVSASWKEYDNDEQKWCDATVRVEVHCR